MDYDFNGVIYTIDEFYDEKGVLTCSCAMKSKSYPVFLRTNGRNIFHYKIGEDEEDEEWECCINRDQLIYKFINDSEYRDVDNIEYDTNWGGSVNALLNYMKWV